MSEWLFIAVHFLSFQHNTSSDPARGGRDGGLADSAVMYNSHLVRRTDAPLYSATSSLETSPDAGQRQMVHPMWRMMKIRRDINLHQLGFI